jgi:hypothetical protein
MPQKNYEEFVAVLRSRYGAPTTISSDPARNQAGSSFSNLTLRWDGKRVSFISTERFQRMDVSAVVFSDQAAIARQAAGRDAKTKADAAKL